MTTTPLTEMFTVYKKGERGLTKGEKYGKDLLAAPEELASAFVSSVAQFSRYANVEEPFHDGPMAPPFTSKHGQTLTSTVDVAQRLYAATKRTVEGTDGFDFAYVDRELDVMRTSATQFFDDGKTPTKRALVLDLLLSHEDDTPILTEVKIGKDTHPIYALVQILAAAAHLATPAQRARLAKYYGFPPTGSYLDLALLLVNKPTAGKSVAMLADARELASVLLRDPHVSGLIRTIHFLVPNDFAADPLVFRRA